MISYEEFCKKAETRIRARPRRHAVITLNIDNFQLLGLLIGQSECEAVLETVGHVVEKSLEGRGVSTLKYADVFVVVMEYEDKASLVRWCERIATTLEGIETERLNGFMLKPTIGIYIVRPEDTTFSDMQIRLVIARRFIKNRFEKHYNFFGEEMAEEVKSRKRLLDGIKRALRNGEFQPWFQPIYDAQTMELVSAEALIRWTTDEGKQIMPGDFIDFAEEIGIITAIDDYMLNAVCEKQAQWQKQGLSIVPVSVNISRQQLHRPGVVDRCRTTLHYHGLTAKQIRMEITEGTLSKEREVSGAVVDELMAWGIRVLIDDFGTGYSSLRMLKRFTMSMLKIDKSFVDDMSITGKEFIKCILQMAQLKGMKTIAEGVETRMQYEFLKQCGCDMIQGYYTGKPQSAAIFARTLASRRAQSTP